MTGQPPSRDYLIVSPARDEADYMRHTLDSIIAQTTRTARWITVDEGSTDASPEILAEYAARHDWITVIRREDRGRRVVGPGVIEAFYAGLDTVSLEEFTYLCKLDLPPRYFETLIARMEANPRIGTCSGKPYVRRGGRLVSERRSDEMSVGMTKFYRCTCFKAIGGFVRGGHVGCDRQSQSPPDGLEGRDLGSLGPQLRASAAYEIVASFDLGRPPPSRYRAMVHGVRSALLRRDLSFPHGRAALRAGDGAGLCGGWWRGEAQHEDAELRAFIRAYQREALLRGKARTVARIEAAPADAWVAG